MIIDLIKKHLQCKEGITILDLGPGYSNFALEIANLTKSNQISFFDNNEEVLEYQVKQCSIANVQPTIYQSIIGVKELNKISEKYDLVLCQEILEHLNNPEEILQSIVDLLNIGGKIIITVPTKKSELLLKKINSDYMLNEPFGHIQLFNKKRLVSMIKKSNLKLEVLKRAQPHFFIAHLWMFGSRMKVEGATGKVLTNDWRNKVGNAIFILVSKLFYKTSINFWSNIFPRNYFIIATRNKLE